MRHYLGLMLILAGSAFAQKDIISAYSWNSPATQIRVVRQLNGAPFTRTSNMNPVSGVDHCIVGLDRWVNTYTTPGVEWYCDSPNHWTRTVGAQSDGSILFTDQSTPVNPGNGSTKLYSKAGKVCSLDSAGNENCTGGVSAGGGYSTVQANGVTVTQRSTINLVNGANIAVSCSDASSITSCSFAFSGSIPTASSANPAMNGTAAPGVSSNYARADHVHPTDTTRAPTNSPTFTGLVTMPGSTTVDSNGIKGPIVACVGAPGSTTGPYRSLCVTTAGAAYACANASGCTVAADWAAQGGGGGTTTSASASIDFGSIAVLACGSSSFAFTGAATGDAITPIWPSDIEAGIVPSAMYVSAANTVTVIVCNASDASIDPAAHTFGAQKGGTAAMVYPASAGIATYTGSAWGASVALDTDTGLTANSDSRIPSQKATKVYVDAAIARGQSCTKYTVAYNNAAFGAATSADVTLFTAPANWKAQGITIKHSAAFAGGAITAINVSVGWSGSATAYAPAFDIFQATGATVMQDSGGHYSPTSASHAVTAHFSATGANLNALTAGSVDIWACGVTLP